MGETEISWSQRVWNPVRGCRRVSPGCGGGVKGPDGEAGGCYAEAMAARLVRMGGYEWIDGAWRDDPKKKWTPASRASADKYKALVRIGKDGTARWTGVFAFDEEKLSEPLRRKAPTMYFVNSMSDLFGEGLTNEQIAAVFGVMAACPQHTFQCLTKRPARMVEWFKWIAEEGEELEASVGVAPPPTSSATGSACVAHAGEEVLGARRSADAYSRAPWPLPNVWIGVSVERQEEADERIPLLLQCPAAVRWVSAEPLLGPVDLKRTGALGCSCSDPERWCSGTCPFYRHALDKGRRLDWIVWGGESGHGARPCDVQWIRDGVTRCREAGVPPYVKQLGARVIGEWHEGRPAGEHSLRDKKGADMAEWPEDLRVREWPAGFVPPKSKALPVLP